jgi:hypothetical protein
MAATASHWGGRPQVPPDWVWPVFEDRAMVFLGQINCADLEGLPGAERLPAAGLLAFFADQEELNGCGPTGGGTVYYWGDLGRLGPARQPSSAPRELPLCAMAFRPLLELPDPSSTVVREILPVWNDEVRRYFDIRDGDLRGRCFNRCEFEVQNT